MLDFTCKNGKFLIHKSRYKYVTEAGYETFRDYYQCEDCSGCPYAEECKKTPPLKQVMDSQMGKIPQRYTRTKVFQYAVVLKNPSGGKYPAYEIVK